jgi:fructokinase
VKPSRAEAADVVVIGEALVDVVEHEGSTTVHPGGSPLNVAFGLGRLGFNTVFATEFGDDSNGRLLRSHLDSANVHVIRELDPAGTSLATARLGAEGSATYDFTLRWNLGDVDVPPAAIVHTGSIGAMRQPGRERVREIVRRLPPESLLSFDPNIRPSLAPEVRESREIVDWYDRHAQIIKLSDEDADWLLPGLSASEVLEWFLDRGAGIAVLTRGASGSMVRSHVAEVEIKAPKIDVVDTIGAGDAYMSGLIGAIIRLSSLDRSGIRETPEQSLRDIGVMASTVATLTVQRAGALPPTEAELSQALGVAIAGQS